MAGSSEVARILPPASLLMALPGHANLHLHLHLHPRLVRPRRAGGPDKANGEVLGMHGITPDSQLKNFCSPSLRFHNHLNIFSPLLLFVWFNVPTPHRKDTQTSTRLVSRCPVASRLTRSNPSRTSGERPEGPNRPSSLDPDGPGVIPPQLETEHGEPRDQSSEQQPRHHQPTVRPREPRTGRGSLSRRGLPGLWPVVRGPAWFRRLKQQNSAAFTPSGPMLFSVVSEASCQGY